MARSQGSINVSHVMEKKLTITGAIQKVLQSSDTPLTHKEIYDRILKNEYYNFGAKDPISIVRNKIRKHCVELNFPSASPKKLFTIAQNNERSSTTKYAIWDGSLPNTKIKLEEKDLISEELIYFAHKEHIQNLKNQLLDYLKSSDTAFFEKIVIDLLLKMGYGWDKSLAGHLTGGTGDEGIDGVIYEDKLGLEKIYIQAKRYTSNAVSASEIRDFIGAMSIKGARKGVFFTSSDFTSPAKEHAKHAQAMNITLINGPTLCDLLIQHEMGIEKIVTYSVYEVDKNFFDE